MKPRILIIENSIAVTGALKSIVRSSVGLKEEYEFFFILPKNSRATKDVREAGFEVHELPMMELRKNIFSLLVYFPVLLYNCFTLQQQINRLKIDLINVNDFYNLLAACYKIFGGKVPYVCYVRFLPARFPKRLVQWWCGLHRRFAARIIAVSEAVQKQLPYPENVVVIGNELPDEKIPFSPSQSQLILYPANYTRGKGQECALQSFVFIQKKHPQWKLKFIGGDMGLQKNKDFKAELMNLANTLLLKQVEWHDFSDKISDDYLESSIVLNFSESESFSMTCLEAMFYGRPVIATRSGGPSEIIDENQTGTLVDVNDISNMATAIDFLISNPLERDALAKKAYETVREKFSNENTVKKLGKLYHETLASGH